MRKIRTITDILNVKKKPTDENNPPLTMLTAYDAFSARMAQQAGIDIVFVGDSLAMTMQGNADTNTVTMDEMIYHTKIVVKNAPNSFTIADMPFLSYEGSVSDALFNAGRLFREGGVRAVKMEGAEYIIPQVKALVNAGIPVMGHIGLTPQRAATFGGFKAQGRDQKSALKLLKSALALQEAGCFALVLEAIPQKLAKYITEVLNIPTIGIGAGLHCDGQVLVFYDILGMSETVPRFVKQYANLSQETQNALNSYIKDVQNKTFPEDIHTFSIPDDEWDAFIKEAQ